MDLAFVSALAMGRVLGVSRLSDQARSLPAESGRVVVAINGDFYERDNRTYAGDPRGLQIVRGELVSGVSTATVWWDTNNNPQVDELTSQFHIKWPDGRKSAFGLNQQRRANMLVLYTSTYGESTRVSGGRDLVLEQEGNSPWLPLGAGENYRGRVRNVSTAGNAKLDEGLMVLSIGPQAMSRVPETPVGTVIEISTATTPDLRGVKTAISGGPILIKDGKRFSETEPPPASPGRGYSERSKYERHPRSAIGWNTTNVFLVTVDGRQPGLSVGMTLAELASYLVKLGCTHGMNFDGGASATLWMSGQIINDPCQGERAVANSLLVVRKRR